LVEKILSQMKSSLTQSRLRHSTFHPLAFVLGFLFLSSFGEQLSSNYIFCEAFTLVNPSDRISTTSAGFASSHRQSSTIGTCTTSRQCILQAHKATISEEAPETMTTSSPKPNWRILNLPKDDEDDTNNNNDDSTATHDFSSILSHHEKWSQEQYESSLELYHRLMDCADSYVSPKIKDALHCLDQAYRLYGPRSVICSYNGGKDAVVILHLVRAAHAKYCADNGDDVPTRPRMIYFEHQDEFPEVLSLLRETVQEYDLDMIAFGNGCKFSDGLKILVENNNPWGGTEGKSFPMAFVLGTRDSDPNAGSQGQFAPSSHYMPPFMRVNPVLKWTYGHVWHFLRLFELPYCSLYDAGYTSLGTTKDTLPCPALAVAGSASPAGAVPKYWPAYMLRDWDQERAGRIKKEKKSNTAVSPSPKRRDNLELSDSQRTRLSQFSTVTVSEKAPPTTTAGSAVASATSSPPASATGDAWETASNASSIDTFASPAQRSVGLLVIGDEILKGLTMDTNTNAAATMLRQNNVLLKRVVTLSDDQDDIVKEIKRMKHEVDIIITSGGVGPTHDDVTIKSVAAALDRKMVLNEQMVDLLKEKMAHQGQGKEGKKEVSKGDDLTEAQIKMATLPFNSKLRYLSEDKNDWPILQCQNLFILPGVPQFFSEKIESLAIYLSSQLERSITYRVVLSVDEPSIVDVLNAAVQNHPNVIFGSYPFVDHPDVKTVLTLEGRMVPGTNSRNSTVFLDRTILEATSFSKDKMDVHVQDALDDLIKDLPERSILRVDNDDGLLFS